MIKIAWYNLNCLFYRGILIFRSLELMELWHFNSLLGKLCQIVDIDMNIFMRNWRICLISYKKIEFARKNKKYSNSFESAGQCLTQITLTTSFAEFLICIQCKEIMLLQAQYARWMKNWINHHILNQSNLKRREREKKIRKKCVISTHISLIIQVIFFNCFVKWFANGFSHTGEKEPIFDGIVAY